MLKKLTETIRQNTIIGWVIVVVVMVGVFLFGLLAASITERRAEIAPLYANQKVEITGIHAKN